jgi:hypothetical protein
MVDLKFSQELTLLPLLQQTANCVRSNYYCSRCFKAPCPKPTYGNTPTHMVTIRCATPFNVVGNLIEAYSPLKYTRCLPWSREYPLVLHGVCEAQGEGELLFPLQIWLRRNVHVFACFDKHMEFRMATQLLLPDFISTIKVSSRPTSDFLHHTTTTRTVPSCDIQTTF